MDTNERLEAALFELVYHIDDHINFYSEEARLYFIENVIDIIIDSPEENVEQNLFYFLEENYYNYPQMQNSLNEGIGDWVRGAAKAVGSAIGGVGRAFKQGLAGGRPAEKIAFGPAPTTQVVAGKEGGSGGGDKNTPKPNTPKPKKPKPEKTKSEYEKELEHQRVLDLKKAAAGGAGGINFNLDQSVGKTTKNKKSVKNVNIKDSPGTAVQQGDNKTNIQGATLAQETPVAQRAATDATVERVKKQRTGGRIAGQLSDNPSAVARRQKTADRREAAKTQTSTTATTTTTGAISASPTTIKGVNIQQGPVAGIVNQGQGQNPASKPKTPEQEKSKTTRSAPRRGAGGRFAPTAAESESLNADTFTDIYSQYMDRFLQG